MRKSSLILLLAMAFVLTTVAAGFSDDTVIEGPCTELCEKCWGYELNINSNYDEGGSNQYYSQEADPCPLFDFESSIGYCGHNQSSCRIDETTAVDGYYNAPGVVFKVCGCDDPPVTFEVGHSYGIKIEIIDPTPSGVYFTDQNIGDSNVSLMSNDTCDQIACGDGPAIYVAPLGDTTENETFCPEPCDATIYKMTYEPLNDGKELYNVGEGGAEECCLDCIGNLARAVRTSCVLPFMVAQSPYILIDLPTMVWDPKNITDGDEVVIRITIFDGETNEEVCTACADLCSCVVKVGVFGCPTSPQSDSCNFCLPYFTDLDQEGWWSGFALTNSSSSDAVAEVTFYAGGTSEMVTIGVPGNSVVTRSLAALSLTTLEGKGGLFAEVKAYRVSGENRYEASMSGFAIMGDGSQAYGYLSKAGYCGCDEECDR